MGMTVRDTTMLYLSQMMGKPVVDIQGEKIGTISDLAISTGEVFPRITSLAFQGPGKVPFMISWRKYVDTFDEDGITLNAEAHDIRFSYLQPDEVLLARDLLNRQIVDTQGLKVVRVNDLKLSVSGSQLRLLGAEVGARGILRGLASWLERAVVAVAKVFGKKIDEQIIAWNYMDLLDRDLSEVQLSVTHKRLDELHPADVADILEQLDPSSAPTCSSTWTTRRPPRPSPRWTTSTRPTSSKTSTTPAPPASWATWTRTTRPTSCATCRTRKPRRCCASWAWRTPPRSAACWATRTARPAA